jgi:hypothetical protein
MLTARETAQAEPAGISPFPDNLPSDLQQQPAKQYLELLKVFVENSDIIEKLSFGNLHVEESWLNIFLWMRVNPFSLL